MATIGQHISNIRGLIKEFSRNPDSYTDQELYQLLNNARTRLLEINANKINHNSEWDWQTYPVFLVKDKSHLINCIQVGCDILRSEYKLPRALLINNKSLIDVFTFSRKPIILGSEIDWLNNKYDDVKSNQINVSIIDDYLIVWNNMKLKAVLVKGIWEDITDWASLPQCNDEGEIGNLSCYNPLTDEFPLSLTMADDAYKIVLEKLSIPARIVADKTNDSNNEIRQ